MTFKIGDKVRYSGLAAKRFIFAQGVFKVTGPGDMSENFTLDNGEIVHESWLEKVEEEYGVGDIICARKGKEIVQNALVKKTDGALGLPALWSYTPSLKKLREEGYSIQLVEKAKPVEPESSYIVKFEPFGEHKHAVFAMKINDERWSVNGLSYIWSELINVYGEVFTELVEK